jgi:hypothetical protein
MSVKLDLTVFKKYSNFLKPIISKSLDDNLRESLFLNFEQKKAYFFGDDNLGIEGVIDFEFESDEDFVPTSFGVYVDKIFILASRYDKLIVKDGIFYDDKGNKFDYKTTLKSESYEPYPFNKIDVQQLEKVELGNDQVDIFKELNTALYYSDPNIFEDKHGVFFKDDFIFSMTNDIIAYISKLNMKSPLIALITEIGGYFLKAKGQDIKLYKETVKYTISDYEKTDIYYYLYLDDDFCMRIQSNIRLDIDDSFTYDLFINNITSKIKVDIKDLENCIAFIDKLFLKNMIMKYVYIIVDKNKFTLKIDSEGIEANDSFEIIENNEIQEPLKIHISLDNLKQAVKFLKGQKEGYIGFHIPEDIENEYKFVYALNEDLSKMTVIYEVEEIGDM